MLKARLYEARTAEARGEGRGRIGAKTDIGWGHQIRSYVLQPYQMVKDLRTGVDLDRRRDGARRRSRRFMAAELARKVRSGGRERWRMWSRAVTDLQKQAALYERQSDMPDPADETRKLDPLWRAIFSGEHPELGRRRKFSG